MRDYGRRVTSAGPCTSGPQPGVIAFRNVALRRFPALLDWGIYNCRRTAGGARSTHGEGRAWDAGVPTLDHPAGRQLARFLVTMHRELGVQRVIWSDRVWDANRPTVWRQYHHNAGTGSNNTLRHRDHVHVEFSWRAAVTGWEGFPVLDEEYVDQVYRRWAHEPEGSEEFLSALSEEQQRDLYNRTIDLWHALLKGTPRTDVRKSDVLEELTRGARAASENAQELRRVRSHLSVLADELAEVKTSGGLDGLGELVEQLDELVDELGAIVEDATPWPTAEEIAEEFADRLSGAS